MIKFRLYNLAFCILAVSFIGLFGTSLVSRAETATLFAEVSTNDSVDDGDSLEINWTARVSGNAKGGLVYSIDCDSDGVFEETSSETQKESYDFETCEYEDPGDYLAKVVITRGGNSVEKIKNVKVKKSVFITTLSATPNSGLAPLNNVNLIASISGDVKGRFIYKFDCEDDGVFEFTSPKTKEKTYTAKDICSYSKEGVFKARVLVTKGKKTSAEAIATVTVIPKTLNASLTSTLDAGTAPLNGVGLIAAVGGNAIGDIIYKFDCTSDGAFEHTSLPTTQTPYTVSEICNYENPGIYTAIVVAERQGLTAQSTANIVVIQRTLVISVSANPSSGVAPLSGVNFIANISGNATGDIIYKVDCTNDGTFEHVSANTNEELYSINNICEYQAPGDYTAKFVVERQGLTVEKSLTISVLDPGTALTASLVANPSSGVAPLNNVGFEASVSGVASGDITYKIDCTNDGTFEHTSVPTLQATYTVTDICNYTEPGNYEAKMQVDRIFSPDTRIEEPQIVTKIVSININVFPQPLVLSVSNFLTAGEINQPYSLTFNATGGLGNKTFSMLAGTLPPGLTLSSDGIISGTPTRDGIYYFKLAVTDEQPVVVSDLFTIFIAPLPADQVLKPSAVGITKIESLVGGTSELVNANNTKVSLTVPGGAAEATSGFSIIISGLNVQSTDYKEIPSDIGGAMNNLQYEIEAIDSATAQKITNFNKPVIVKVSYLESDLPQDTDESKLRIYFFNEGTLQWELLSSTIDTENNIVSAEVPHLTRFALVASAAPIIAPSLPRIEVPAPSGSVGGTGQAPTVSTPKACADKVDFNGDKNVNLVDFSILAYWYKKGELLPRFDLNSDGKVDLTEFSILIYCWKR